VGDGGIMAKTISIIGAGPIGSYLAYLLASQGREVNVYEEHGTIGLPVHCTGIVTSKFCEIIKPDEDFVLNTITKARIYSPNGKFIELKLGQNYVLERSRLDQKLAEGAKKADARFFTSHKFIDFGKRRLTLQAGEKTKMPLTDILVGADGPNSAVAKSAGLFGSREFFIGAQVRARLKTDNAVEFYLTPKAFSWIVPESKDTVRIGSVARTNPKEIQEGFLRMKLGPGYREDIIDSQGGRIPVHNPRLQTSSGNIFLVGDAATMVKATTGGGIVPGLQGAEALAEAILEGGDYERLWRERIGRELRLSLMMRTLLDSFSARELNLLIGLMDKKGIKDRLENYDRDSMTTLLPGLILEAIKEPRFFHFARHLLNRNLYI
jgi:digeranylgeranylglycerophospholipid reductase